jgi:hypothetical protein
MSETCSNKNLDKHDVTLKCYSHIVPNIKEVSVHFLETYHIHHAISGNVTSPFVRRDFVSILTRATVFQLCIRRVSALLAHTIK